MNKCRYRCLSVSLVLIHCIATLLLALPGMASDAYIKTDGNEIGQGIIRQRGSECLVITPLHVIENAFKIEVTLADKQKLAAEMIEAFPGDIGLLRIADQDSIRCKRILFENDTQLDALLENEKQGELRIMLADGSIRRIPVQIAGYDKFRNIHVTPSESSITFAKGESGSPLYIAGHFSGILLSVKNKVGIILRSDALAQTISLFFNETSKNAAQRISSKQSEEPAVTEPTKKPKGTKEQQFSGGIAKSAVAEHTIRLEGNSPVRLSFLPTGANAFFNIEILDSARRIVFQNRKNAFSTAEAVNIPFTPPMSDVYSIFIAGTQGEGKYAFTVTPITSNAQLRGEANELFIGGNAVHGIIASGAVAEYRVQLEENSPVRLHLPATGNQVRYSVDVLDATGNSVYRDAGAQHSATDSLALPFTPPKHGEYRLRLKGTEGEGAYSLQLLPIASNSQLRGEANVLAIGGNAVEGIVAQGAVAEYRIPLEAVHPIRFHFTASGDSGQYNLEIVDSSGMAVYVNPSKRYRGTETFAIPFTAPKNDTYSLRMHGLAGECRYSLQVLERREKE